MRLIILLALAVVTIFSGSSARAQPTHAIAMLGKPQLPENFSGFTYANPLAPKGGIYRRAEVGSFDTLNPFIIKGTAAAGLRIYLFESLMARNRSEAFSLYGLIAQKVDMPEDRRSITFYLNPKAKFSDGTPITTKDVLFSFKTLREKGRPNHRTYYKKVSDVKVIGPRTIRFEMDGSDRELPLILGLMPILSSKYFSENSFEKTTLKPIVASGPYVISKVLPGQQIIYKKDPNYWGSDLPVSRGLWNFDEVRYEYFRDSQAAFEAFRKNLVDSRFESDPAKWAKGYKFEKSGKVVAEEIKTSLPKPTSGLVFNTRRPLFANRRVREALNHVFDFEWANANLFHKLFARTQGFYSGSRLSSFGIPASATERAILTRAGAKLETRFLDGSFRQPVSDGTGRDRAQLRKAVQLLARAGWKFKNRVLTHTKTGKPFAFEMLVQSGEQEKIALHFRRSLRQIGIAMSIRLVDSSQFQRRLQSYDYDMVPATWFNSLSPGNEQSFYWGASGRTQPGTRNYMGVADPAIDHIIAQMVKAPDRKTFRDTVRALDRVLVSGFYIIPLYHTKGQWLARWKHIKWSGIPSYYGFRPEAAWFGNK